MTTASTGSIVKGVNWIARIGVVLVLCGFGWRSAFAQPYGAFDVAPPTPPMDEPSTSAAVPPPSGYVSPYVSPPPTVPSGTAGTIASGTATGGAGPIGVAPTAGTTSPETGTAAGMSQFPPGPAGGVAGVPYAGGSAGTAGAGSGGGSSSGVAAVPCSGPSCPLPGF